MLRGVIGGWLGCSIGLGLLAGSALAAVPHTVQPGESMWSISAANGLTTQTLALYNGVSEEELLLPCADCSGGRLTDAGRGARLKRRRHDLDDDGRPCPRDGPRALALRPAPPRPRGCGGLERDALRGPERLRDGHLPRRSAIRLSHLRAAGRALPGLPRGLRRAGQPARQLIARVRDCGRRRVARDALGNRPDWVEVRLVEGPRPQRVVARGLRRRLSVAGAARTPVGSRSASGVGSSRAAVAEPTIRKRSGPSLDERHTPTHRRGSGHASQTAAAPRTPAADPKPR